MNDNTPIKTLTSKIVYENPWIRVHEDTTTRPEGHEGIYGYVESKDSVFVAALNDKNEVYLIHGFRYPTQSWGWELPGGSSDGEHVLDASKRELAEETGITAADWTLLGSPIVCNGLMTERMIVYLAQNLSYGDRLESDDNDLISGGKFVSFDEIDRMIDAAEIDDSMTMSGLFLAKRWLAKH